MVEVLALNLEEGSPKVGYGTPAVGPGDKVFSDNENMQSLLSGYQSPRVAVPYGQGHATVAPRNLMVIGGKGARAVRLRGKDGLVRDMMMYKVYEEAHGRSIRRLLVKAVQEEGSGGKEGTVPTKGTRPVKEEAESGRKIMFAVDGTVAAEEGLRWFARQIVRKGKYVPVSVSLVF